MTVFTAAEKLKEIERELGYRRHVYPRRIMESIAEDYRAAAAKERLL